MRERLIGVGTRLCRRSRQKRAKQVFVIGWNVAGVSDWAGVPNKFAIDTAVSGKTLRNELREHRPRIMRRRARRATVASERHEAPLVITLSTAHAATTTGKFWRYVAASEDMQTFA